MLCEEVISTGNRCHWVLAVIGRSCAGCKFAGMCKGEEVHLPRQKLSTATCRNCDLLGLLSEAPRCKLNVSGPCTWTMAMRLAQQPMCRRRAETCCDCFSLAKVVIILPG